ncbi:MAG TPA: hydroxysqualene dehydroxylase HpnE [Terriglobales bacterium]|nr:hydroxysqualene dehydroxylase HpnE [Terriglobales bacterium]
MSQRPPQNSRVAVVGGGLAGLAAGCALASSGFRVTLFERRPYLGGRASSYQHPGTGEVVDNCQHVLLGCCTNLIQFYERLGVENKIRWYDRLTFLEPGGRASVIAQSKLPAPLHNGPAFLRAACLDLSDKLVIGMAMAALAPSVPRDTGESFLTWLRRHEQTKQAIERFWKPVLVSALNEELDRMSVPYAAQVVRESFLKSTAAGRMGVPTVPLTELYSVAGDYIAAHGGEIHSRCGVESFATEPDKIRLVVSGEETSFDFVVFAVPFDVLSRILPQSATAEPLRRVLARFETSPITGIHLWFDRQITDLDHAVLLDRTIQWMFHKSKILTPATASLRNSSEASETGGHDFNRAGNRKREGTTSVVPVIRTQERASAPEANGSYVELVVSSSKTLVEKSRAEIIELALAELREFFPGARNANLLKSTVIKEVHATYSPRPGVDVYRPRPETVWPRVFLAGDWTATGWPATMEGAVRSGYMAAESVARAAGIRDASFLVPDLPASGSMRLFG